jgi:hypothetical protein
MNTIKNQHKTLPPLVSGLGAFDALMAGSLP